MKITKTLRDDLVGGDMDEPLVWPLSVIVAVVTANFKLSGLLFIR